MSALHAIAADWVFDGTTRHPQAAVVVEGARIAGVVPRTEISGVPIETLPDPTIFTWS